MVQRKKKKELELYLHIPFCVKKCAYCDFLSAPGTQAEIENYVDALIREIKASKVMYTDFIVPTIFFGGGTPSLLSGEQMQHIMDALSNSFVLQEHGENSMELNPGTVTKEKLKAYKVAGINRLSIGLQSTNERELQCLSRIHTYQEFLDTYRWARMTGFQNINVDLMSAIPGQTRAQWQENLKRVLKLEPKPEHISAYSLIIEQGTKFYQLYGENSEQIHGKEQLPDENTERQMYEDTKRILGQAGFHQYEISNYSQNGYECRHNLGYWERTNYLGLGLGSASLIENVRFKNTSQMEEYLRNSGSPKKMRENVEILTTEHQMEEYMFLGLRKIQGISANDFQNYFGKTLEKIYGSVIDKLVQEKLLLWEEKNLHLTERGIDISNYVFEQFLL